MSVRLGIALKSAVRTIATLLGGIAIGMALGHFVFSSLPNHSMTNPAPLHVAISAVPLLLGLLAGGAAWGRSIGRLFGVNKPRRMAISGMAGFVPVTLVVAFALLALEPIAVERFGAQIPIHRVFTVLFVPAAFLVAAVSSWALGRGFGDAVLARSLFWRVGLAAAAAFLATNLIMEFSGWVVGAPHAGERATMLVVMTVSDLAAAFVGGGMLGWIAAQRRQPGPGVPSPA